MAGKPIALVTGAARGIGKGCALALARAGFDLVMNAPESSAHFDEAIAEVEQAGAHVVKAVFDISDISQHEQQLAQILDQVTAIDCLVNNAGVSVQARGDLLEVSAESFDEQIDVNLRGTFFLTQAVARAMLQRKRETFASIITISSSNAEAASIERGEYCIAKSALSMMNKLFAVRLAEAGICTYEVRPGLIATDMTAPVKDKYNAMLSEGFSPINRWGQVEDVADVVTSLAQGSMKFSTGETVHVDGGLLIARY